jgi:hypothetical protein
VKAQVDRLIPGVAHSIEWQFGKGMAAPGAGR